jgi:hypothetical protein
MLVMTLNVRLDLGSRSRARPHFAAQRILAVETIGISNVNVNARRGIASRSVRGRSVRGPKEIACLLLSLPLFPLLVGCSASGGARASDGGDDATVASGVDAGGPRGDGGAAIDAPGAEQDARTGGEDAGCGSFASDPTFTCTGDGTARARCVDGSLDEEPCAAGCLRQDAGQDSICQGDASDWSCPGAYGTTPVDDGNYYMSEFGCYVDDAGVHTDPGDNCIPSCFTQARAAGLCDPASTGPDCEEKLGWYTADGARFGCLQRLRVTNPVNGKSLIAVALDFGPGCTGEDNVSHAVLDSSGLVNNYLFGGSKGASEKALVHVVEVDESYPLGPVP